MKNNLLLTTVINHHFEVDVNIVDVVVDVDDVDVVVADVNNIY